MLRRNVDHRYLRLWLSVFTLASMAIVMPLFGTSRATGSKARSRIGAVRDASAPCSGAEVQQAVDPELGYV